MSPATVNAILSAFAEIEPYAIGAAFGVAVSILACWIGGCFEPKRYMAPRRNPSTGHRVEQEIAR